MRQISRVIQVAFALLAGTAFANLPCQARQADAKPACADTAAAESLEKKWGIEIACVRVSAGGYMVDFRYKVLDPEKAAPLADRKSKPFLIDQASGAKMLVPSTPKLGSLRQTAVKLTPGRIYGAMFANPAKTVKAGSKVTVVVGDCRLENLVVE